MTTAPDRSGGRLVDRSAVVRGAVVAGAVCLPLALIGQALEDQEASPLRALVFVGVLVGFAAGGLVAARAAAEAPFTNGGLAALLAYVAIQGTAVALAAATDGSSASVPSLVFNALLAFGCGVAGSALAGRRARRAAA